MMLNLKFKCIIYIKIKSTHHVNVRLKIEIIKRVLAILYETSSFFLHDLLPVSYTILPYGLSFENGVNKNQNHINY